MSQYEDLGYDKVFVALDGSEQQAAVLDRAITAAVTNNAHLVIGHVIDSTALETTGSFPANLIQSLDSAFRDSIADQVAAVEQQKAKVAELLQRHGVVAAVKSCHQFQSYACTAHIFER